MTAFKKRKTELSSLLMQSTWKTDIDIYIKKEANIKGIINPLLAFLMREDLRWQSVWSLGKSVTILAESHMEDARIIMRRLMWSMNEESGNLGWGVPEAMGSILANHPGLAQEYSKILLSYMIDTGHEDNFIEYTPLRRGVYWAAGYLAACQPQRVEPGLPALIIGLNDEDPLITGYSAWAILQWLKAIKSPLLQEQHAKLQVALKKATLQPEHFFTLLETDTIKNCSSTACLQSALTKLKQQA